MKLPKLLLTVLLVLVAATLGAAQTPTGLSFLKFGTSAEGLSMADARTADARGAFATYYNPAGLAGSSSSAIAASHNIWVGNTRTYNAAAQFDSGEHSGWGGMVTAVSTGDIEARQGPTLEPDGVISAQFLSVGLSYARVVGPIHAGATLKYLTERIATSVANGYAFDVGLQVPLMDDRVQIGGAVQHVGQMEALDSEAIPLPRTIRGGVSLQPFRVVTEDDGIPFLTTTLTADVVYRSEAETTHIHTGLAAEIFEVLALRGGYLSNNEFRSFSLGGGLDLEALEFDYSYLPFDSNFGTGHVITLAYLW